MQLAFKAKVIFKGDMLRKEHLAKYFNESF